MKLKDRRHYQIMQRMKEILLDSEKDIGVLVNSSELINPLENDFGNDELVYTVRLLMRKGYLDPYDSNPDNQESIKLTVKGFDEWLFPLGKEDFKRIFFILCYRGQGPRFQT